jgi:hypothetical protein
MPPTSTVDACVRKHRNALAVIGARLVAARAEVSALACRCTAHPDDDLLYLEWAQGVRMLEECQEEYVKCVQQLDYPEHGIRGIVEGSDFG